ncbi:hypothetical protein SJ263_23780, partial [Enterobacter hormaechei]|uniref:hypothetical protein n=1 Tax=Enterobacter hormaechei TaxID=158836 RepID=UPI0029D59B80
EAAYVELSRGRHGNWLVLTAPEINELDRLGHAELDRHDHGLPLPDEEPGGVDDDLTERLSRSRAKYLALTRDPDAGRAHRLALAHT